MNKTGIVEDTMYIHLNNIDEKINMLMKELNKNKPINVLESLIREIHTFRLLVHFSDELTKEDSQTMMEYLDLTRIVIDKMLELDKMALLQIQDLLEEFTYEVGLILISYIQDSTIDYKCYDHALNIITGLGQVYKIPKATGITVRNIDDELAKITINSEEEKEKLYTEKFQSIKLDIDSEIRDMVFNMKSKNEEEE